MGVVVSAWDPTLDRKVAIKLLRHGSGDGTDRLLREAQALARLAHVNVVSVFDVGIADGQAFVAMEFVAGTTLARWVAAGRPWRERLRVLLDAGRGLAAVHDAGLVHRDVKPDNVMIDEQGRVRLMDLGLATPSTATAADPAVPGALAGTPAYMAPEQFLGASATRARISSPGA
jgi:serine/threonine protein kinase